MLYSSVLFIGETPLFMVSQVRVEFPLSLPQGRPTGLNIICKNSGGSEETVP